MILKVMPRLAYSYFLSELATLINLAIATPSTLGTKSVGSLAENIY